MPSRKQRRRREKLKRHEYEYVVENEEGEEVPVERPAPKNGRSVERKVPPGAVVDRRGRVVPKPSLQRVLKRTMILFPLILLFILVAYRSVSTLQKVLIALELLVIFVPFSYVVDRMMYRSMEKRQRGRSGRS